MEQALQKDARAGRFRAALEVIQRAPMRAKLSFVVMGLGQLCYGQIVKGLLYLTSFLGLLWYFIARGFRDIAGFFTLGTQQENLWLGIVGDNSMQMLILGLFAIFILIFFLVLHISNVRDVLYTARQVAAGQPAAHVPPIARHHGGRQVPCDGPRAAGDRREHLYDPAHRVHDSDGVHGFRRRHRAPAARQLVALCLDEDPWRRLHRGYVRTHPDLEHPLGGAVHLDQLLWRACACTAAEQAQRARLQALARVPDPRVRDPGFISMLGFKFMFSQSGPINQLLLQNGHDAHLFLSNVESAKWWARGIGLFVNGWITIPSIMLMSTGILSNISPDLYEAPRSTARPRSSSSARSRCRSWCSPSRPC